MTGDIHTNGKGAVMVQFNDPNLATVEVELSPDNARGLAILLCDYADKADRELRTTEQEREGLLRS